MQPQARHHRASCTEVHQLRVAHGKGSQCLLHIRRSKRVCKGRVLLKGLVKRREGTRALYATCQTPAEVDVLVIGSGGREHALAWKLRQSASAKSIYCAPGNAGISLEPGIETVDTFDISDSKEVAHWCTTKGIDLVVVGPEAPLVAGICDDLRSVGIRVFGPSKAAAQLEGSKAFLKELCDAQSIPTAQYRTFTDCQAAKEYIQTMGVPIVVKADGLAAGKGVVVAQSLDQAYKAVDSLLLDRIFGQAGHPFQEGGSIAKAGDEVIVEEFLQGEEVSFFALIDGQTCLPIGSAQDHKAAFDGDRGPNTGGMGAYSPAPALTPEIEAQVMRDIVQPTADGMVAKGLPFQGVLFAGLMVQEGKAKLLEHNVRFGDPECECLMLRLKSDLLDLLFAAASGDLKTQSPEWSTDPALTVIMATKGYPGQYGKGSLIQGIEELEPAKVFHCGTAFNKDGELIANGGRVLAVSAAGSSVAEAQTKAYKAVEKVRWPEGYFRSDIGWRAV